MAEPALPFVAHDGMLINSGPYSGLSCEDAIKKMSAYAEEKGFGKATVTYRLKDWGISRQRYWGTPIPMLYCEKDGIVAGAGKRSAGDLARERGHHAHRRIAVGPGAGVRQRDVPEVRRPGAARDRHDGHVRRFVLVLLSLHRRAQRPRALRRKDCPVLVSASISTLAASSTPFCI